LERFDVDFRYRRDDLQLPGFGLATDSAIGERCWRRTDGPCALLLAERLLRVSIPEAMKREVALMPRAPASSPASPLGSRMQ